MDLQVPMIYIYIGNLVVILHEVRIYAAGHRLSSAGIQQPRDRCKFTGPAEMGGEDDELVVFRFRTRSAEFVALLGGEDRMDQEPFLDP